MLDKVHAGIRTGDDSHWVIEVEANPQTVRITQGDDELVVDHETAAWLREALRQTVEAVTGGEHG